MALAGSAPSPPSPARGVRAWTRARLPQIMVLLFAPAIPELLTGSTPISNLFFDPLQFAISFGFDIGLYGTGALLIREFVVHYRKGWASTLLLGAAYGIAEEGLAVHTFTQPGGNPVGLLGSFGHAFGVNWIWALGLTVFHATYSIALPLLLVQLWYPAQREVRWLSRRQVALTAAIYLAEVGFFGFLAPHGPAPPVLALFLALCGILIALAYWVPRDALTLRPGPARIGPWGLMATGSLGFLAWVFVLISTGIGGLPAPVTAAIFVAIDVAALALVLTRVGALDAEWSEFYFSTGMLSMLFLWDIPVEFSVPGILLVAAVFAYLQFRLRTALRARLPPPGAPRREAGGAVPE